MATALINSAQIDTFFANMTDSVKERIVDLGIRTLLTKQIKKHGGSLDSQLIADMANGTINPFPAARGTAAAPKLAKRTMSLVERYVLRKVISGEVAATDIPSFTEGIVSAIQAEASAGTSDTLNTITATLSA